MTEPTNWRASLIEQRTAWGIAICGMLMIMLAATQAQWFELATPQQSVSQSISALHTAHPPITTRPALKAAIKPQASAQTSRTTNKTPLKKQPSPPSITHGFYVQLGAFEQRPRAQKLASQLKKQAWKVRITRRKNGLHAVWLGPKPTRAQAEKLMRKIQNKLKYKGFIVHHNT